MIRELLPNRRTADAIDFRHGGIQAVFTVAFACFPGSWRCAEIFLNAAPSQGDIEKSIRDAAILASMALQHGCPLATLVAGVTHEEDGAASSIIGAALILVKAEIERLSREHPVAERRPPVHETRAVRVWANVDVGIAEAVVRLNEIPGVRTHGSCQGTIGEGGAEPYGPLVDVTWENEQSLALVRQEFDVVEQGACFGTAHPRVSVAAVDDRHDDAGVHVPLIPFCRDCGLQHARGESCAYAGAAGRYLPVARAEARPGWADLPLDGTADPRARGASGQGAGPPAAAARSAGLDATRHERTLAAVPTNGAVSTGAA